MEAAEDYANNL